MMTSHHGITISSGLCRLLMPVVVLLMGCAYSWDDCDQLSDCRPGYVCELGRCVSSSSQDVEEDLDVAQTDDMSPWEGSDDGIRPDQPVDPASDFESDGACGSVNFPYTETPELLPVPANVSFMHIKVWGAGGNEEHLPGTCPGIVDDGGLGGYSEAVFEVSPTGPVKPDSILIVIVGKLGQAGVTEEDRIRFGFGNWGGGGLSGVFIGPDPIDETSQDRALIVAGGGGGSAADCADPGGTGNSEQAGGQTTMQGSAGSHNYNGGGGGYHGGSGGAPGEPGMGGTGFIAEGALDSVMKHSEPGAGVPPETEDDDYVEPAGVYENNGLVIIRFTCEQPVII